MWPFRVLAREDEVVRVRDFRGWLRVCARAVEALGAKEHRHPAVFKKR